MRNQIVNLAVYIYNNKIYTKLINSYNLNLLHDNDMHIRKEIASVDLDWRLITVVGTAPIEIPEGFYGEAIEQFHKNVIRTKNEIIWTAIKLYKEILEIENYFKEN